MTDQFLNLPDGRRLCYRDTGKGTPLILVIGLSLQLTAWPEEMLDGLERRGFRLITLDNRDVGRSSRIAVPPPSQLRLLMRWGRPEDYVLSDMAGDVLALMDHLSLGSAHLAGMSMGGMIAQTLAATHPARVRSLVSIFSNTGARRHGQPSMQAMLFLMKRPARTRDEAIARHLGMMRLVGGTTHRFDEDRGRAYAAAAWERGGPDPHHGVARQMMAILKSGDRTASLGRITAPTLVLHGDRDLLVHPSGGVATAAAIPGARLVQIGGMGHDLAPSVAPELARMIADHAEASGAVEAEAI
ncbi:alpha/beta fold hydrolase [Lutimaribacter marinistellae]|uniref:Alpha/beta fold hydrolase n=1 Tax=Lutimaribacter marinistellae TaxID=1820329 RepID=A0ABV7TJD2_9RHOB